jgi:hypothetical protein
MAVLEVSFGGEGCGPGDVAMADGVVLILNAVVEQVIQEITLFFGQVGDFAVTAWLGGVGLG